MVLQTSMSIYKVFPFAFASTTFILSSLLPDTRYYGSLRGLTLQLDFYGNPTVYQGGDLPHPQSDAWNQQPEAQPIARR